METLRRLGAMLAAPHRAVQHLARAEQRSVAAVIAPFGVYLLVELIVVAKVLYWSAILATDQPLEALERLWSAVWKDARNDLAVLAGAVVILFIASRLMKTRIDVNALAAHLLIPLSFLKLVGVATLALGVDQWWLPHHPVDSPVIFVGRQLSWTRFVVKQLVAYGPGAALILWTLVSLRRPKPVPIGFRGFVGAAALVLALVLAGIGGWADAAKNDKWLHPAVPGDLVKDERLPWIQGPMAVPRGRFSLKAYRGKIVVLDFWASWCAPCRRAMPELSEIYDELKGKGVEVVGVSRDQGKTAREKAESALYKIAPSFPSALDTRHWGDQLGLRSLPTTFVIDREGVLRHLHLGYTEPAILRAELAALLKESP